MESSCNIKFYEGTQSLNWNRIMQTIKDDPKKFHTEDGGWSFLSNDANDDDSSSGEVLGLFFGGEFMGLQGESDFAPGEGESVGSGSESEV